MLTEPSLAGIAVVRHRALGVGTALVGLDPHAPDGAEAEQDGERDDAERAHGEPNHITRLAWRGWGEPLYTSRMKSLRFLLPLLVPSVVLVITACGGGGGGDGATTPGGGGGAGGAKPAQAGDVSIEIPAFAITGVIFEPQGLGRPGMPLVEAKRKTTVEKQRQVFTNTKDPVQKEAQAAILATMLYLKSKDAKGEEQLALIREGRQALRDAAQVAGANVDEVTLRLLGSYEIHLEDYPAAEKAWELLVQKAPKDKEVLYHRAWWAYALLKQFKNVEALAVVKDQPLTEKQPELAYVTAWAKWRANDDAGAWQAMTTAAKGWTGNKDFINEEVYLFAARSSVSLAEVTPQLFALFNAKQKGPQYEVLVKLGLKAYALAGRWADAVAALDNALETIGKEAPVNDVPVLRYSQADYTVRLDNPDATVKYAKQAIEALPLCGQKCSDKDKQDLVTAISGIARVFHFIYATANDIRYYQPANDLYLMTIPLLMDTTIRNERNKDAETLQRTLKNTKVGTGTHDKDAIRVLAERHNQEIHACYESALTVNPKVGGTLSVTLESDETGVVKGVTTEPKAGLADLSLAAGCVADAVRDWKLPKRGMPGSTRIKLSYTLATKKS